jgi:NAD(P)-dependent dehydrogenase (short-subunit alcohol dehydrogenase family)
MSGIPVDPPSRSLRGRVAIVTGAGCAGDGIGNGRAISILLADDGCDVVCLDMNLEWCSKTAEMANAKAGRGTAVATRGDVTSAVDCEAVVQFALERFGRLDILVNNVGISGASGTAVEVDMAQWAKSLETNVSSMVQMTKYAIPAMTRNDGEMKGSIVNMGSVAGLKGGTPHLLYPTSKGAVVNMTRAMAAHHAKDGIRVNCVCPGVRLPVEQLSIRYGYHEDQNADLLQDAPYTDDVPGGDERGGQGCKESAKLVGNRGQWLGLCMCSRVSYVGSCEMANRCHSARG